MAAAKIKRQPSRKALKRGFGVSIMTAQPITHHNWNGNYVFGNEVLIEWPEYGAEVSGVISGWAFVEATLGRAFASLIGARQPVTMTMYNAARSFDVQRALLEAAVDDVLPVTYSRIFKIALIVINRSAIHRHRFAHWLWGRTSSAVKEDLRALLLVEPRNYWNITAAQIKYWNKNKRHLEKAGEGSFFVVNMPLLKHEHIWAYTIDDLKNVRAEIEHAFNLADALRDLARAKAPKRREILNWLKSDRQIREVLAAERKRQKSKT